MIVSFTTFLERLPWIQQTIQTMLNQTVAPDKIILWIGDDIDVESISYNNVIVKKCATDYKSYNKLLWTLKEYPNEDVIIIDDDMLYQRKMIQQLVEEHNKYPNDVICCSARQINIINGELQPYQTWQYTKNDGKLMLPIGSNGVYYPAGCFSDEVFNSDIFLKYADTGDDLWFKVQLLLNDVNVRTLKGYPKAKVNENVQSRHLIAANTKDDKNRTMMNNLINHYNIKL